LSWSLLIRWAQRARCQAETPLIVLCRFPGPALTDRPMSEYESAIYEAVCVLLATVLDLGARHETLVERLMEVRDDKKVGGSKNGAAAIDLLIRSVS